MHRFKLKSELIQSKDINKRMAIHMLYTLEILNQSFFKLETVCLIA